MRAVLLENQFSAVISHGYYDLGVKRHAQTKQNFVHQTMVSVALSVYSEKSFYADSGVYKILSEHDPRYTSNRGNPLEVEAVLKAVLDDEKPIFWTFGFHNIATSEEEAVERFEKWGIEVEILDMRFSEKFLRALVTA